ncbi:MAG TPA: recombination mediator RecR [Candidatus Limnocylindria bacterium]|jgi:recombination protein RecR|nr:recombination mediator RecR [Deltaproteobacteria bacterium]MDH3382729.1 recombination mediator RecR [Deltaproteobacteria bacterium]HSL98539.1 recombination mediator RecR [Candidatus Limnocylindria bacterium]
MSYPKSLRRLIALLAKLPGVGEKTATRLALHMLKMPPQSVRELGEAIVAIPEAVIRCSRCFNIADEDPCPICTDPARRDDLLCVVESPTDLAPIEKSGEYRGRYHVLGGAISPIDGVMPEDLRVGELLGRLSQGGVAEVILATNLTAEGEATATYLAGVIKTRNIRVTRIAYGMPVGSDLEYTDEITVGRAIKGRRDV